MNEGLRSEELVPLLSQVRDDLGALRFLDGTSYHGEAQANLEECRRLVSGKLSHEAGRGLSGPLVVAVAGGTNVGKSTCFNHLAGRAVSPVDETAGATKAPAFYLHERHEDVLGSGTLLPGYAVRPLADPAELVASLPERRAFFSLHREERLAGIALVDSPDVDSTVTENARVGLDLLYAADLLVLVTTDQKYLDRRPLEYLALALDLDREVLVVFNKMQGDEAFRTILDDFNREMRERRPGATDLPAFRVPHYGRGGPAPDARRGPFAPVLERLTRGSGLAGPDLASLKRRGFSGTARYLVRQARRVLDVHAREREQLARIVADVRSRAALARSEYEAEARRWSQSEFHELTSAERSVLESYRLVPVLGHVRQGVGKVFSFVKSKLLGREGSTQDVAAKIARRREVAYERALGIARQAATETSAALRRARDGSEVARPVYERLADLDSLPAERLKAAYDARVTALDELTARIEDRLRKELDSSPAKRATLQFLRDVLPLGGLAAVVIPAGIHVTDVLWGALSTGVSEFALRQYFGAIVREFREEFVRRHLEIFDEILATGYTDRALAAIPEGPDESRGPAARLREALDRLEELAAVRQEAAT